VIRVFFETQLVSLRLLHSCKKDPPSGGAAVGHHCPKHFKSNFNIWEKGIRKDFN